jgi:hypothetical protein
MQDAGIALRARSELKRRFIAERNRGAWPGSRFSVNPRSALEPQSASIAGVGARISGGRGPGTRAASLPVARPRAGAVPPSDKEELMTKRNAFAITLATLLAASGASAEPPPRDDSQAPRAQEQQAPREHLDEVQAPRGQDEIQAPRGQDEIQAPRGEDEIQAPRGQARTSPGR